VDADEGGALRPTYHRQAFKVDGRFRFWGGLTVEAVGGGLGLVDTLSASAERAGITLRYQARAIALTQRGGQISGVQVRARDGNTEVIPADAVVLAQPRQFAWQIFDAQVTGLLRDEYRIRQVTKVTADTLEELARKLDGVDPDGFLDTVKRYNEAVQVMIPFNPNVKDGRGTEGITLQKSNWANRIDTPPFEAYVITCGITFTFGGLAIDARTANVLAEEGHPIPGLFACGELVGGLFYFNYPGGAGLTSGAVFGRVADTQAARHQA